jgi:iron-sulfur cluster repair protein YtfE (RIC family)
MDNDQNTNPGTSEYEPFPVDRPVQALLRDHDMVRKLARVYLNSESMEARTQAALQILPAIDKHSRLEESVFYPAVRQVDSAMIDHFRQDHQKADDLLATLLGMLLDEPETDGLIRELISVTMGHMLEEEDNFFPKLDLARLDMTAIGLEMQAFAANLVPAQAQANARRAAK